MFLFYEEMRKMIDGDRGKAKVPVSIMACKILLMQVKQE